MASNIKVVFGGYGAIEKRACRLVTGAAQRCCGLLLSVRPELRTYMSKNDITRSEPSKTLILGLYFFCFSPLLITPVVYNFHQELSAHAPYKFLHIKYLEFIQWADFFFETESPLRSTIPDHDWYLKKFSRLMLLLSVLVLFGSKLLFRSNRLDIDLSKNFQHWRKLPKQEQGKKFNSAAEWTLLVAFIGTFISLTNFGMFPRSSSSYFFAYFSALATSMLPLLCWRMFFTLSLGRP